jgi:hypothetical protein
MSRRAHIPTSLVLACGLLVTSFGALGCKESKQVRLPPGDWLGRTGDFGGGARAGVLALIELARTKHIPAEYRPAGCPSRS